MIAEMQFREYPVHPALAPFVKCIWSLDTDRPVREARPERILPDGCVELVFHFGEPFRSRYAQRESHLQPQSLVVGQMRRWLEIEPSGRVGFVAVRFYARGAYLFFREPLAELTNQDVDLENVWGREAAKLTENVGLASDMARRVGFVEVALLRILRRNDRFDRTVDHCLGLIESSSGQLDVAQLAKTVGISSRHLSRRFHERVGVSPKEFARVSRFLHAVRRLAQRRDTSLTDIAIACGYFDQAHFNHEFRELAGMTPREFFTYPNVAL
jgi:AraC-like DNA-binding protein